MSRLLFIVKDTFLFASHGLVLFPGIAPIGDERFKVNDAIRLNKPDGTHIDTKIAGFELPNPNLRKEVVILLKGLAKEDVPVGTEVWSLDAQ